MWDSDGFGGVLIGSVGNKPRVADIKYHRVIRVRYFFSM
jgi:hypothetical protein